MSNLLIFGPPGAGKGTQADLISQKYHQTHLSSGDILRNGTDDEETGKKIKELLSAGQLVPDSLMIGIMEKAIDKSVHNGGFILDGYPRTIPQAEALDAFFDKAGITLHAVLNLELTETEAIGRILARGKTSGRSDDNAETAKTRLEVYRAQTAPLLKYYRQQGKVIDIDGHPSIEDVFKAISERLEGLNK